MGPIIQIPSTDVQGGVPAPPPPPPPQSDQGGAAAAGGDGQGGVNVPPLAGDAGRGGQDYLRPCAECGFTGPVSAGNTAQVAYVCAGDRYTNDGILSLPVLAAGLSTSRFYGGEATLQASRLKGGRVPTRRR